MEEKRNFNLAEYTEASAAMIATNENAYKSNWDYSRPASSYLRQYSSDEVSSIITQGSLTEQQKLSRTYFDGNGYYKRIIIYYATLLKYMGILIPNPSVGKDLSNSRIMKKYYEALEYVEVMQLPSLLANISQRALVDGSYYGLKVDSGKNAFQLIDLPSGYARSRFKDINGNDIVEFDVSYFDTILDEDSRKAALAAYPKMVARAYREWRRNKKRLGTGWTLIPKEIGVCFPFFGGRPLFIDVIPSIMDYDDAVLIQRDRDIEDIRKIIVQKVPHLSDGRLLFEPDEAKVMHQGSVNMMKGNKNINILTTYTDVDAITSSGSTDRTDDTLTRMEQNIYSQTGVSGLIFAATGSSSLESSLNNDLALMMYMASKYSRFITNVLNGLFSDKSVSFTYKILPISHYNADKYGNTAFKLASSGYSFLVPALAQGITQRDLGNLKDLENKVLKLGEKLIPLASSYTQSNSASHAGGGEEQSATAQGETTVSLEDSGRPPKEEEQKSDKTLRNEESLDRTGG